MSEEPEDMNEEEVEDTDLQEVREWCQADSIYGTASVAIETLLYRGETFVIGLRAHCEVTPDVMPDVVYGLMQTGIESQGVMLTAGQARQLAAAFLNAADEIDELTMKRLRGE